MLTYHSGARAGSAAKAATASRGRPISIRVVTSTAMSGIIRPCAAQARRARLRPMRKITSVLSITCALLGCGGKSIGLEGTWESPCLRERREITSDKLRVAYDGNRFEAIYEVFRGEAC